MKGHLVVNKFKARFSGPYIIVNTHENTLSYLITKFPVVSNNPVIQAHFSQLRPWIEIPEYLLKNSFFKKYLLGDWEGMQEGELMEGDVLLDGIESEESEIINGEREMSDIENESHDFCRFEDSLAPFSLIQFRNFPDLIPIQVEVNKLHLSLLNN